MIIGVLENDSEYATEYNRFVQGMSYASGKVPSFKEAMAQLKELTNYLLRP